MSFTARLFLATSLLAAMAAGGQLLPSAALAEEPQQDLHNVTYRARIDGVSRGATITYNVTDTEVETANPKMLPGQPFEANAVLADPKNAGMEISIRWPYTANLHCEILVDDAITAQADEYIAPRLLPQSSDPAYGVMPCGGELANAAAVNAGNAANATPPAGPPAETAPSEGAPPS